MGAGKSLLFFGLPGLFMTVAMRMLFPRFVEGGMAMHWSLFLCLWIPIVILIGIVLFQWKKSPLAFSDFFWITPLCKKCLAMSFLAFVVVQVGELALEPSRGFLSQMVFFQAPDFYPDFFKPHFALELPLKEFLGMEVRGNALPFYYWFLWIIVNIGGEELLWRGYALPRMELYFGKYAWLVNGLLWNLVVHSFMPWAWITLLPISLIVPFMSQRTKSLWPGVIIHGMGNLLVYALLIPSV